MCVSFTSSQGPFSGRGLLIVPPIAEEMNKSRRMMSLMARAAAVHGYYSLLLDLYGTGDSEGDFGKGSVEQWRSDLAETCRHIAEHARDGLDILAIRGGALLLSPEILAGFAPSQRLALWQPVVLGRQYVGQLLRLRLGESLAAGGTNVAIKDLREQLARDSSLELAGYRMSAALLDGLEGQELFGATNGTWQDIGWFEVGLIADGPLSPAATKLVAKLRQQGSRVQPVVVPGEPFWATPEIVEIPALIERTLDFLSAPR